MKPMSIFLIEDDQDMVEDIPALLAPYGMQVDCLLFAAGTKTSVLTDRLKSRSYGCVVLDVRMPPPTGMTVEETEGGRLTGVLVCREIRKELHTTPILVFTAVSDPDVHQKIREAGANFILAKPAYPDQLAEAIKQLARSS